MTTTEVFDDAWRQAMFGDHFGAPKAELRSAIGPFECHVCHIRRPAGLVHLAIPMHNQWCRICVPCIIKINDQLRTPLVRQNFQRLRDQMIDTGRFFDVE